MQFSELPLDHRLLKALEIQNFVEPTEIQKSTIPAALSGKDVLAASKTGSGKTLAYLVPAVQRLYRHKALSKQDPRILVVTPTRELAMQVYQESKKLLAGAMHKPTLLIGGENFNNQVKALKKNPDVIIGTPGRIADHIEDRSLFLAGLELLIFDEADRILDLGFSTQLQIINDSANHRKRQTMLFSATFDSGDIRDVSDTLLIAPHKVLVDDFRQVHQDIEQAFIFADHLDHKEALLGKLLLEVEEREQIIVFVATRDDSERLRDVLNNEGKAAVALHGELLQQQRNQIMSDFRNNKAQILVTTDLASRGLDIPQVKLVINFDMPLKATEYVHRVGRTGRAGNQGIAFSLVGKKDWKNFVVLKELIQSEIKIKEIEGMVAKFKGFKEHVKKRKPKTQPKTKATGASQKAKPKNKFDATAGTEVGHLPLKRKQN